MNRSIRWALGLLLPLMIGRGIVACGSDDDSGSSPPADAGTDAHVSGDAGPGSPGSDAGDAGARDAGDGAALGDGGYTDLGWTSFPGLPGTDGGYTRALYVDSVSGSDSNDGTSAATAVQHVSSSSKLYALLEADAGTTVVLLKPGSSWTYEQFEIPVGGTAAYPLLFTGIGWPDAGITARPSFGAGIRVRSGAASHLAFTGLQVGPYPVYDGGGGPSSFGISISAGGGTDYLIEDCVVFDYFNLLVAGGSPEAPLTDLRVRRNYLYGAYGGGPVVAFDGNDIVGALFEENFFDYNGGPDGNYLNDVETAPYSNELAHDVYFADDGMLDAASGGVIAFDVTFRRNLFSRTLQSVKGPYSGKMDDNLFYGYSSGGYLGPWGASFANNVMVNGGGFSVSLDNAHGPNEDAGTVTHFCNNLEYNLGAYVGNAMSTQTLGSSIVGVNLDYRANVIDGFAQALIFQDEHCFGYDLTGNLLQANDLLEVSSTWPQAQCPLTASGNGYHLTDGPDASNGAGYALEVKGGATTSYSGFGGLEAFLGEDSGAYSDAPFAFVDPSRTIGSYMTASGLAGAGAEAGAMPTIVDFMKLVRAQSAVAHTWSPALDVTTINAYLRAGHAMQSRPFAYDPACP